MMPVFHDQDLSHKGKCVLSLKYFLSNEYWDVTNKNVIYLKWNFKSMSLEIFIYHNKYSLP